MAQTELNLRKVAFSKTVRGYSCEEVDTYLAYANDRYNALARECVELRRKMTAQAAGQNEYREEALKEKDKIAAETEALVEAARTEAARVLETAKQKAARLLADAETAAAGILKQAEANAAQMPVVPAAEPIMKPMQDEADIIAAQNNIADRMVAEIESFRQSVFNMYAKHIEDLDELARLTDRFYETKEALSAEYQPGTEDTEVYPEELQEDADEAVFMPVEALEAEEGAKPEDFADFADFAAPAEDDDFAAFEDAGESDAPEEADDSDILASLYSDEEDDELLRIDWKMHRAALETRQPEAEETDELWGLTESDEEDPLALFAAEDAEEDDIIAQAYAPLAEDDGEILPEEEEDSEEAFLSDIASEYLKLKQKDAPAKQTAPAEKKPKSDSLDDFFEAEEGNGSGLTGEFDFIYSSKKSADNVAQIRKQPLVDAQRPEKPKKHGNN